MYFLNYVCRVERELRGKFKPPNSTQRKAWIDKKEEKRIRIFFSYSNSNILLILFLFLPNIDQKRKKLVFNKKNLFNTNKLKKLEE